MFTATGGAGSMAGKGAGDLATIDVQALTDQLQHDISNQLHQVFEPPGAAAKGGTVTGKGGTVATEGGSNTSAAKGAGSLADVDVQALVDQLQRNIGDQLHGVFDQSGEAPTSTPAGRANVDRSSLDLQAVGKGGTVTGKGGTVATKGGSDAKGPAITAEDLQRLVDQLSGTGPPSQTTRVTSASSGPSKGILAGIAGGVAAVIVGIVLVVGGGGSSDTTAPTGGGSTSTTASDTAGKGSDTIGPGTTYAVNLVMTEAVPSVLPIARPPLRVGVGDTMTARLVFDGGCTPKLCGAQYVAVSDEPYGLAGMMTTFFTGHPTFEYTKGTYRIALTAPIGCSGYPAHGGFPETVGTVEFSFKIVPAKRGQPPTLAGTARTNFGDPYTTTTKLDGTRQYCVTDHGTWALSGTTA